MSTRGTIRFNNIEGKELVNIDKHCDSYIEGLGKDIANFLNSITVVNGIRLQEERKVANGFGCLIAQFIVNIKNGVGNVHIEEYCEQDYNYIIQETEDLNEFNIEVYNFNELIFKGNKQQFIDFVINYSE